MARELPGVLQQILHRDPEQLAVADDDDARAHLDLDPAVGLQLPHPVEQQGHERAQVHFLLPQLGPGDLGEVEHVVDQLGHLPAGLPDPLEELPPGVVEPLGLTVQHRLGVAVDPPEGGPEVVGDGVAEALQLPILVLQIAHQLRLLGGQLPGGLLAGPSICVCRRSSSVFLASSTKTATLERTNSGTTGFTR